MAAPTSQSSGLIGITAGQLLYKGKNILNGVSVPPGGTVTIYDNAIGDTSGNVLALVANPGTATLDFLFNIGVRADLGLSVVVATAANGIVYFGGN